MNSPDPTSPADAQAQAIGSTQRGVRPWAAGLSVATLILVVFDRRTTVNLWTRPVCLLIGGWVAVLCVAYFLSLRSTARRTGETAEVGKTGDNLLGAVVVGLVSGAVTVSLCGTVAQYLPGTPAVVEATVLSYRPYGGRGGCYRSARLAWASGQSTSRVCLERAWHSPIDSVPTMHVGDEVSVHLIRTPLGDVVRRIDVETAPRQ